MIPRLDLDLIDITKPKSDGGLLKTTLHANDIHGDYSRDSSHVAALYAVAHEYAKRYAERRVTIKLKDSSVRRALRQTFYLYSQLLPENVSLKFKSSRGNQLIRGSGKFDPDFHANARYLVSLAELERCDEGDPIDVAGTIDFHEFLTYRKVRAGAPAMALLLDADDCIYNYRFRVLLAKLISTYLNEIKACAELPGIDGNRLGDFSDQLMDEIISVDFATFTDDLADEWISHINSKGVCVDDDLIAVMPRNVDERYKVVFRQYIRYLNQITPAIMTFMLYRANETLFEKVIQRAEEEKCVGIIVKSFSARQSHYEDAMNQKECATGSFMHDLHEVVKFLNHRFHQRIGFVHDRFLMADAYNKLTPGESYKRHLTRSGQHPYSVLDASKTSMLIIFTHYLKSRYHGIKLVTIVDDRHDLFAGFLHLFKNERHREILPGSMQLFMVTYDGDFDQKRAPCILDGSGHVQHDVDRLMQWIVRHSDCDLKNIEDGVVVHHVGKSLRLDDLLAEQMDAHISRQTPPQIGRLFQPVIVFHHPEAYESHRVNKLPAAIAEKATYRFH